MSGFCPGLDDTGVVSGEPSRAADDTLARPALEEPPVPAMTALHVQPEPVEEQEEIPPLETSNQALEENVDAEEETPYPKSEVEVLAPAELESPVEKDTAIPATAKQARY